MSKETINEDRVLTNLERLRIVSVLAGVLADIRTSVRHYEKNVDVLFIVDVDNFKGLNKFEIDGQGQIASFSGDGNRWNVLRIVDNYLLKRFDRSIKQMNEFHGSLKGDYDDEMERKLERAGITHYYTEEKIGSGRRGR